MSDRPTNTAGQTAIPGQTRTAVPAPTPPAHPRSYPHGRHTGDGPSTAPTGTRPGPAWTGPATVPGPAARSRASPAAHGPCPRGAPQCPWLCSRGLRLLHAARGQEPRPVEPLRLRGQHVEVEVEQPEVPVAGVEGDRPLARVPRRPREVHLLHRLEQLPRFHL